MIGIGPSFEKYGNADAMNLGGPVTWRPDFRVIVASSGDLGVNLGNIVPRPAPGAPAPAAGAPPGSPFFTIWRRANACSSWRYVAE